MSQARAVATVLAGAVVCLASSAVADPLHDGAAQLGPRAEPTAPPPMERRSDAATSAGLAAVSICSLLLVSSALAGGIEAACPDLCDHTPVIIGMAATGGALLAAGIPLILYGAKMVPAAGPTLALVPRKPLPAWVGAVSVEGWSFRF